MKNLTSNPFAIVIPIVITIVIPIVLLVLAVTSSPVAQAVVSAREAIAGQIAGQYIVVLEEAQFAPPGLARAAERRQNIRDTADVIASRYRGRRQHVFAESLTGFSVSMTGNRIQEMENDPRVAYIVPDKWVTAAAQNIQLNPPSWGLDRIDQRNTALDNAYEWYAADSASEVHVYVLDTGIRSTHADFGGRVDTVNSFNAYNDGNDVNDCNGHGTHVAGIIAGDQYGVAKRATLHPVRVLTCSGAGSLSAVIAGVDWITTRVIENQHPAVANMSLASSPSLVLDNAIQASIEAGVSYAVAAGNSGESACQYSPARVTEALTVGATTIDDTRMTKSNYGDCVDIYAPGATITSTFNRDDTDALSMSGTSMAAPHVAGTVALMLAQKPNLRPAEIADELGAQASSFVDEFGADGTSPLVYSMIELESAPSNGGLEFTSKCHPRSKRCVFTASLPAESGTVERYFWDFGDGSGWDHKRPIARHGYRGMTGSVTVILAVELTDGTSYMTTQVIELPF